MDVGGVMFCYWVVLFECNCFIMLGVFEEFEYGR